MIWSKHLRDKRKKKEKKLVDYFRYFKNILIQFMTLGILYSILLKNLIIK